jgi:SAM-dependent methyltransferase
MAGAPPAIPDVRPGTERPDGAPAKVAYGGYDDFPGWDGAPQFFRSLIERSGARSVLEIGAGANPTLAPAYVREQGLRYTTNDVSTEELAKAGPDYETLCLDMATADRGALPESAFDLIFSRMVNEHVSDGRRYYRNILDTLAPGGISAHCFSTLYAAPFVVNRLLPDSLSGRLFEAVVPRAGGRHDKFSAHYSWSRGPSRRMIDRLTGLGFEVVEYRGYFGHRYYARRGLGLLNRLEEVKSAWLLEHPLPALTSYAAVILRKPG